MSAAGGAGGAESNCVAELEPGFRLRFEEIALDDDPQEITAIEFVPGSDSRLLMLDKQGRLRLYQLNDAGGTLVDKLQLDEVYGEDDCGAVSLAFDPRYEENHFVYVGHCVSGSSSRITRLSLEGTFSDAAATAVPIIELGDERATKPWHNVGSLGFDDESVLWAVFGEKTVSSNAQDSSVGLGKLLRIVPSRVPEQGGFEPAPDNAALATDPSIFALGLRSPWKAARDLDGRYWVGDVGADTWEELNLIASPGQNLGWPKAEGPCQTGCQDLTDPLLSYSHTLRAPYVLDDPETDATNSRAIWVAGPFGRGATPDPYRCNLRRVMLFGDYFTGWVRAVAADASGQPSHDQHVAHLRFASAFTQDAAGTLYAATLGVYKNHGTDPRGRLYRAVMDD